MRDALARPQLRTCLTLAPSLTLALGRNRSPHPEQVRDALAYLQLLVSDDPLALSRVINVPPRKIGKATLLSLEHTANASGLSMWQARTLTLTLTPKPAVSMWP